MNAAPTWCSTAATGQMLVRFGPLAFVLLWSSSFVSTRAALNYASPLAVAGAGVLALTTGTLYYARFCRDVPLLPGTTVQFVSAAAVCAAMTSLFETPHVTWNETVVAGLVWNAGAVSFGGMALYFVML